MDQSATPMPRMTFGPRAVPSKPNKRIKKEENNDNNSKKKKKRKEEKKKKKKKKKREKA